MTKPSDYPDEIGYRMCRPGPRKEIPPEKTLRFALSPSLGNGDDWTVVDFVQDVVSAVERWCEEMEYHGLDCIGDRIRIETVAMTQEEVNALPEI